ncbi:MAG TPA: hypothetical protein VFW40_13585 [Capsulimonadaceae bacterium]|nr:hypothetical protein [Capsulimonadaceae bacterium]
MSTALNSANQDPNVFGPHLLDHPDNEGFRAAAMIYYSRVSKSFAQLRKNTFAMIEFHPDNVSIYYENATQFYVRPKYRDEIIRHLEDQLRRGHKERDLYWILAKICAQGAIPPVVNSSWGRARFIRYFGLAKNAKLQTQVDLALADKAVQYFKDAIAVASDMRFYPGFYSKQLAALLQSLDREEEALEVCKAALPVLSEVEKADFLVQYADCLLNTHQPDEAKRVLGQVRACDTEGFDGGSAHATTEAETLLGLTALREGNIADASDHLLASCQVQKCPHNVTKGFSLALARKLLDSGQATPVIQFCETVLAHFTPTQKETEELLHRAREAEANHANRNST